VEEEEEHIRATAALAARAEYRNTVAVNPNTAGDEQNR